MLAAVLLATVIVAAEGNKPPRIYDDFLNGVKWSTTHDYEVHDHDADQDNQPDDAVKYFTILVPTVALESVQDHQVERSADHGKYQVSVEVNGDSGLVDPSLVRTSLDSFINDEEILHHGDFDKVQPKHKVIQDIKEYSGEIDATSEGTVSNDSDLEDSSEEVIEDGVLEIQNDGDRRDNMHEKEVHTRDIIVETTDEKYLLPDIPDIDNSNNSNSHLSSDVESPKSDSGLMSETEPSNRGINYNMFRTGEPYNSFVQDPTVNEDVQLPNKLPVESDISIVTTSQAIVLQEEDQEQHSSASTVANTPLIKVHLLEDTSDKKENTEYKSSIPSPKNSQIYKIKSLKDSPITHISKGSSELILPRLAKDVLPKPERRRILIGVKKRARPLLKSDDSAVSSTTDSLSTVDLDDKLYDIEEKEELEEEEEEEGVEKEKEEDDLQNSPQDQIINSEPIQPQDPGQENLLLYGPPSAEGIPIDPLPPPYPELFPTKTHQPILHHIIHAILRPPGPDDEEFQEDGFLHRYSPNFVPYPAYLAIPY